MATMARGLKGLGFHVLVKLCLQESPGTWDELYHRSGPAQLAYIRAELAHYGVHDEALVDLIRKEVFNCLPDNTDGRLRAFWNKHQLCSDKPLEPADLDHLLARLSGRRIRFRLRERKRARQAERDAELQRLKDWLQETGTALVALGNVLLAKANLLDDCPPPVREAFRWLLAAETHREPGRITLTSVDQALWGNGQWANGFFRPGGACPGESNEG
jgi:hypothetical protein